MRRTARGRSLPAGKDVFMVRSRRLPDRYGHFLSGVIRFSRGPFSLTKNRGAFTKVRMLRVIGLPFMALAMFSIAGGHWAVLQTVAWAQMLRDYSKDATVTEAVAKTFSGDAP